MKTIGLLGGTSWHSTIEYYRILNQLAQAELGGFHSANLLLRSIDYHDIKSCYYDRWNEILPLLKKEIQDFVNLAPDCLLICNNTLHKAFDQIEADLDLPVPVFHIVDAVGRTAQRRGLQRLLLLGTQFTMEDGFYQQRLVERFNLEIEVPDLRERITIQSIQFQLAKGVLEPEFQSYFVNLIQSYSAVDAVVLACTEIPLAIGQGDVDITLLNPTEEQCKEAFEFAITDLTDTSKENIS
ncbi:amino acid racemase [Phormidium tenue FACHB-886]|nr:amino acid racemase [Phormidium tenue FACHB-886]